MSKGKILLVDNNEETHQMMKLLLKDYEIVEAASGEEGIKCAEEQHPNLILMDLIMPDVDGFDATHQIRQIEGMSQIPIIILSAYVFDKDLKQRALESGANECLQKPEDLKRLKSVINDYLSLL